jgi:hypothetical protein
LFYYWEGKHPFDKSIPAFFGVGEIQFDDPGAGDITKGSGRYSESPLVNLDATVRRSTLYVRANEDDVRIVEGNNRDVLEKLISARVEEWKGICV